MDAKRRFSFPKDALSKIDLGKAFAEYDLLTRDPSLFVKTSASTVALDEDYRKCFFVGRRGAGKTAIALQLERTYKRSASIVPQVFDMIKLPLCEEEFNNTRGQQFRTLIAAFERVLLDELVSYWIKDKRMDWQDAGENMKRERGLIENCDFDVRVYSIINEVFEAYAKENPRLWLRQINRSKTIANEINEIGIDRGFQYALVIDRLDDAWSGSTSSLILLMALMHAIVRLSTACPSVRTFLFIRENIYERIKLNDNEFSRLETSVAFLGWTEEKLVELIERRCVKAFKMNTKPKLGGEAWSCFFEESGAFSSRERIFSICQHRPRDILAISNFAIDNAINNDSDKVDEIALRSAAETYSGSRLKELGDEFAENYPNIRVLIGFFYGLGKEFTLNGIAGFIEKILVERKIQEHCGEWIGSYTTPNNFVELLYRIGFLGIRRNNKLFYKDSFKDISTIPKIDIDSHFRIHETYSEALKLNDVLIDNLSGSVQLKEEGILDDLPEGIDFDEYQNTLKKTLERLKALDHGYEAAQEFEDIVGAIIRLCFFRSLSNIQAKVRSIDNRTIKDWVASNKAQDGFWAHVKHMHSANQIAWECKNYQTLEASDFHQAGYYMNNAFGRFSVLVFRGKEVSKAHLGHVKRLFEKGDGLLLLLRQPDLEVFLRQAIRGTPKETHIRERYDEILRQIG